MKQANNHYGDLLDAIYVDEQFLPCHLTKEDIMDVYFYSDDFEFIYTNHIIQKDDKLRILSKDKDFIPLKN